MVVPGAVGPSTVSGFQAEEHHQHVGGGQGRALDVGEDNVRAEVRRDGFSVHGFGRGTLVQIRQVFGGHEADSGSRLHVLDEAAQHAVAPLGFGGCAEMRPGPRVALRVRAVSEVHSIPEFRSHELVRMVIDADDAASTGREPGRRVVEAFVCRGVFRADIQLRAEFILAHVEDVEQSSIPERLLIEPDVIALVEVYRNSELAQRGVGLRSPRVSGLSVAHRLCSEDAFHVGEAGGFAAGELVGAFEEPEFDEVLGGGGMEAVPVGVIADGMTESASITSRRPRLSRTRAFSPTTLKVAVTPSAVRSFAMRRAALSEDGSM